MMMMITLTIRNSYDDDDYAEDEDKPDKGVPVDKEDNSRGNEAGGVLGGKVVRDLAKDRRVRRIQMSVRLKVQKVRENTFLHGNFPRVAIATVTAGLRCPPDTPPLTSTPSITPRPHLAIYCFVFVAR